MKTVRFSQVVKKCGRPEAHLLLTDPKEDHALQTAAKAQRVLTVMQAAVGTKADWGEVGFHPGTGRQYLIFPKSLAACAGKAFIGIKYELLSETEAPRSHPPVIHTPPKKVPTRARKAAVHAKQAPMRARKIAAPAKRHKAGKPSSPAEKPAPAEPEAPMKKADSSEVASLKRQVKQAMQALEQGRQVAAFHLLQKIMDD